MATRGRPPKLETIAARAVAEVMRGDRPKTAFAPKARYDAAGMGRRMAGWTAPSTGPNEALTGLQTIRNRARDTSRNDWSGASARRNYTTSLVGVGITPRFKRIKSKTRKAALTDVWRLFVRQSDADCALNFYGQQTLAVGTWIEGGECFARRRNRFLDEGLTVPMQVQLMESDMLPMFDATSYQGLPQAHFIRHGVEFNKRGKRVAYWFYREHPGDGKGMAAGMVPNADTLVRVAASEVAHMYLPTRPGQIRGVPLLAPVLARLKNIENYDDATLTRQQLANMLVAFIIRKLPPMQGDEDVNPLTGEVDEESSAGDPPLVGLTPGLVQTLADGEEVQWSNPPEAGTTYSDYMRTQHLGTSAGAGIPYEIFSGDIKDVSDRTLRVIINEFRRLCEQYQWQNIIPQFCEKVMEWFAESALIAGQITLTEFDDVRLAEWSPHGWAHIHPVQDPQGKILEIEGGLRSRSSVIGERGDDPDEVDDERAADKAREDELGLTPVVVDPNAPQPEPDDEEDQQEQRDIQRTNSLIAEFRALSTQLSAPAPAPVAPTINVTNHMPPVSVSVEPGAAPAVNVSVEPATVNVPAPVVNVSNSVEPTPINVAAPNVTVQNAVDVPPAEVNVHLPKREITSSIRRDSNGNITNVTQVEKDLDE
jgi:lambda family phage portal protein